VTAVYGLLVYGPLVMGRCIRIRCIRIRCIRIRRYGLGVYGPPRDPLYTRSLYPAYTGYGPRDIGARCIRAVVYGPRDIGLAVYALAAAGLLYTGLLYTGSLYTGPLYTGCCIRAVCAFAEALAAVSWVGRSALSLRLLLIASSGGHPSST
jgi:hypothetical protein